MAQRISEIVLAYKVDDASISKAQASLTRFAVNVAALGKNAETTQDLIDELTDTIVDLGDHKNAAADLASQFADMGDEIGTTEERGQKLLATLKHIGATQDDIKIATAEYERLAKAAQSASESTGGAVVRSGGSSGGRGGGVASAVQRVAGGLGLSEVANVSGLIDDIGDLSSALSGAGVSVTSLVAAATPLLPVIGGVAAAALALGSILVVATARQAEYNKQLDASNDQLKGVIKGVELYYDTIQTGTTKSITADIANRQRQANATKTFADQIQAQLDDVNKQLDDFASAKTDVTPGKLQELQKAQATLQETARGLSEKYNSQTEDINALTRALGSNEVAANDAISAFGKFADSTSKGIIGLFEEAQKAADEAEAQRRARTNDQASAVRERIQLDQQLAALREEGTVQEVEAAQKANKLKLEAAQAELAALSVLGGKTPETEARVKLLVEEIDNLKYASDELNGSIIQSAEARRAETEAADRLKASMVDITKSLSDAAGRAASLGKGILDAVLKAGEDRYKLETSAAEKINDINENYLEKKADLEKRFADRQVEIVSQALDSARKALSKLEQTKEDLERGLGRADSAAGRKLQDDRLTIQIDAGREEVKALIAQKAELKRIRDAAADKEFEEALNRDFASLFFTRRGVNKDLGASNDSFLAEKQQRDTETQQKLQDLQRGAEIEKRERDIQLADRIADARLAYARESAEIETNRQAQLAKARAGYAADQAELAANLAKQIAARRAAYRLELDELNKALAAKVKLELQAQSTLLTNASKLLGSLGGIVGAIFRAPVKRAGGGGVNAFQAALFNEPGSSGNETVRTGGRTFGSSGPALFMSSQPAYVNANRGSSGPISISMPINITGGGDPQATARLVQPIVRKELAGAIKQLIKR